MGEAQLILASRSPRRVKLLTEHGFRFDQVESSFVDPAAPGTPGEGDAAAAAVELAAAKVRGVLSEKKLGRYTNPVVLGADTIVVTGGGQLIGQPTDRAAAASMLGELIGKPHRVVTAAAVCGRQFTDCQTFSDEATVTIGPVDEGVLRTYLDSGAWQGKAGGYNWAQLRNVWPFDVVGDPTTVVGLPMVRLIKVLAEWAIRPTI